MNDEFISVYSWGYNILYEGVDISTKYLLF